MCQFSSRLLVAPRHFSAGLTLTISRLSSPPKVSYFRNGQKDRAWIEDTVRAKSVAWCLSLLLWFAIPSDGQGHRLAVPKGDPTETPVDVDESRDRIAHDMAKKANLERQAALKGDTEKLVKLAGELKEYVDKSNENVLSLDVLKKAEEIEKLAHSVKEKMKGPN